MSAVLDMEDAMSTVNSRLTRATSGEQAAMFNSAELSRLTHICDAAAVAAGKELELLTLLVTDNKLKMTDGERLSAIDHLYSRVRKRLTATMLIDRQVQALVRSRKKRAAATADTGVQRRLYGE